MKGFLSIFKFGTKVKLILLWNLMFCLATGVESVLYVLYAEAVLQDSIAVGKLISVGFLVQAILFIPAGFLNDRIGTRWNLIIGLVFMLIGFMATPLVTTSSYLLFFRVFSNIGWAFILVTFAPILSENATQAERVSLFSVAYGSGTFATFIGTLGGGILADLVSFQMALIISATVIAVSTIPLFMVKGKKVLQQRNNTLQSFIRTLREQRSSLSIMWQYSISKFLSGVSLGLFIPFVTLFFAQRFAVSNSIISLAVSTGTLGTVGLIALNPRFVRRFSEIRVAVLFNLLSALFLLLVVLSKQILLTVLLFILYRSFRYATAPLESGLLMGRMNESLKGIANSIGLVAASMGISAMGSFSMFLVSKFGFYWGYVWIGVIASILSVLSTIYLYLVFRPKAEKQLPAQIQAVEA